MCPEQSPPAECNKMEHFDQKKTKKGRDTTFVTEGAVLNGKMTCIHAHSDMGKLSVYGVTSLILP